MAKRFSPTVLTANDLLDGDAVWWTGSAWSRDIEAAEIAETPESAEALGVLAAAPRFEADVVGPYLVEVAAATRQPILRREAIRADREPTFTYAPQQHLTSALTEAA